MTGEDAKFLSGGNVPQLKCAVLTPRSRRPAVGRKGNTQWIVGMPREGADLLAGGDVPQLYSPTAGDAVRPSGEKATLCTRSVCPAKVRSFLPVAMSQSATVLS